MPATMDFAQAAALGANHLTAWRMLFTKARIQPWETVLIFGIGGGVSLAALQLASLVGCKTIVTSRHDAKLKAAAELGADHTINGAAQDVAREVSRLTGGRGVEVVIENVGQAVWSGAVKSLARGGRIVTCGATTGDQPAADLRRLFIRQLQVCGSTLGTLAEFGHLLNFAERTGMMPVIDTCYPLEQLHAALDHLESGTQFGKIAVTISEE